MLRDTYSVFISKTSSNFNSTVDIIEVIKTCLTLECFEVFTKEGIEKLPENKPVVYKIMTKSRKNNYTGIAKRGRVQERLMEHLPGGPDAIPGSKIVIEQVENLPTAKRKAANAIKRTQPTYNKQGK